MNDHLSEAVSVLITAIIAGIIRHFEKKKILKNQKSEDHFKSL